jgi:hypothetical protein
VLLKNSSLHAKRRHLIGPGIDLANRDFNCVLCPGRCGETSRNSYGKNREEAPQRFQHIAFHCLGRLKVQNSPF